MSVDLHLDWVNADDYFRKTKSALLTLRDGRVFFSPCVHQYGGDYKAFADRYAVRDDGEDLWYTRDGRYYGANPALDIVKIERISAEEAVRRGLLKELAAA